MNKVKIVYIILSFSTLLYSCKNAKENETVLLSLLDNIDRTEILLRLKSDSNIYELGQLPKIEVQLINKSGRTLNFLTSLDGSRDSMRYPHAGFSVFRNDTLVKPNKVFRCGNLDGMPQKCIVPIKTNQLFDPQNQAPQVYQDRTIYDSTTFAKAGKYRIIYFYSTNQDTLSEWLG